MIVVDTSVLVAIVLGEPDAERFLDVVLDSEVTVSAAPWWKPESWSRHGKDRTPLEIWNFSLMTAWTACWTSMW